MEQSGIDATCFSVVLSCVDSFVHHKNDRMSIQKKNSINNFREHFSYCTTRELFKSSLIFFKYFQQHNQDSVID